MAPSFFRPPALVIQSEINQNRHGKPLGVRRGVRGPGQRLHFYEDIAMMPHSLPNSVFSEISGGIEHRGRSALCLSLDARIPYSYWREELLRILEVEGALRCGSLLIQ